MENGPLRLLSMYGGMFSPWKTLSICRVQLQLTFNSASTIISTKSCLFLNKNTSKRISEIDHGPFFSGKLSSGDFIYFPRICGNSNF